MTARGKRGGAGRGRGGASREEPVPLETTVTTHLGGLLPALGEGPAPPVRRGRLAPTPPGTRAAAERAAAGARIGRYVVVDLLGQGGMGVVYKAYDPELGRLVAIKRLPPDAAEPGGAARLAREAQAVAALSHPNIVAVYDVGEVDGDVFIAMEYVDGWRLKEWIAAARRPLGEVLGVFAQAAAGLAAAHDRGLVHRDFKPHNVLVGYDGRVRVVDFGLARPFGVAPAVTTAPPRSARALERTLTPAGVAIGTPRYMAPEQHLGHTLDGRADQFGFCVALFEALAGKAPFPARQHAELVRQVLAGKARPIPREAQVPRWLRALVMRGLARDPEARWPSMHELLAELTQDHGAARRAALGTEPHGERMLAAFPPPEDEVAGARVRELVRRLERARARKERGLVDEALAQAEALAAELDGVDYRPLHAATAYLLGELRERAGDPAGARVALEAALDHAAAAGDDWQLAAAWVRLVHVVGVGLGRAEEAETLARVARLACRRCGDNPSLRARLATHRGLVARAAGRPADALPHLREALALDEATYGPRHWFVAVSLLGVAEACVEAGDLAGARPLAARAAAICEPDAREPTPTRVRCKQLLARLAAA